MALNKKPQIEKKYVLYHAETGNTHPAKPTKRALDVRKSFMMSIGKLFGMNITLTA